jgi:hypothetical protein
MRNTSETLEDTAARRRQVKARAEQAYQDAIAIQPAKRRAPSKVVTSRVDCVLRDLAPGFYAPVGARQ